MNEECVEYTVKRYSQAKYIRIKVNSVGRVVVVAPKRVSNKAISIFVNENLAWIEKSKKSLRDSRLGHKNLGLTLPQTVELKHLPCVYQIISFKVENQLCVIESNNELHVYAHDDESATNLLRKWLHNKAKSKLIPLLSQHSETLNIDFNKVTIRGQRTRWGSCSNMGNINLNRNLLFLKPELADYLILHELCHIVHPNHSINFWLLVEKFNPDYRVVDKELAQSHKIVPLWAYA